MRLACRGGLNEWMHEWMYDTLLRAGACNDLEESWTVQGTRLSTARECTRDEDSELYKLELRTPHGEAIMLALRSGGDAATLRAPLELHGQEAEDFADLIQQGPQGWNFIFECDTIHVSYLRIILSNISGCRLDFISGTASVQWFVQVWLGSSICRLLLSYHLDSLITWTDANAIQHLSYNFNVSMKSSQCYIDPLHKCSLLWLCHAWLLIHYQITCKRRIIIGSIVLRLLWSLQSQKGSLCKDII